MSGGKNMWTDDEGVRHEEYVRDRDCARHVAWWAIFGGDTHVAYDALMAESGDALVYRVIDKVLEAIEPHVIYRDEVGR